MKVNLTSRQSRGMLCVVRGQLYTLLRVECVLLAVGFSFLTFTAKIEIYVEQLYGS